jgi:hypothetical protein
MSQIPNAKSDRRQYWLNLILAGAVGQVGCLTLVVILVAVFGGLWVDARFQTKPIFTISFLIASIPVSLALMFTIVRLATSKIKAGPPPEGSSDEEERSGKHE